MHTLPPLRVVGRPPASPAVRNVLGALARAHGTIAAKSSPRLRTDPQVEFLAFVAHELRNPLAPIRTAAALITRSRPEDLSRVQVVIERQVDHLARMIDDLLDLARSRTGKLTLSRSQVDMNDVLEEALAACRPAVLRRGQRIEVSGEALACTLHADGLRLIQIVTNLVDNASKFSSDGTTVRVHVRKLGTSVELVVSDEGMGMDAMTLSNAFEPFAQASHAAGFNKSGLGIGLAVVRQLAESHGGHVAAESAGVGRGSRFVVTLPLMTLAGPTRPGSVPLYMASSDRA
jgi:signal transduction histidine kinase